ncbi:MAG: ATP-binding protein [Verrucomicrobia bacterium]|nr:ATP-binding protein [Verrucomicrobiota bacterium]
MTLRTVFETCVPRDDVLKGTITEADFAADLAKVIRGNASDDYQKPDRFFANTYPTQGLKNLLRNVLACLSGDASASAAIFRLDTSYGGGKTHGLIALTHAANGMKGVVNVAEFVDAKFVPKTKIRIAAFDGENADPANGRSMGDGVLAHTPWGELAYSLAGKAGYDRVRKSDESHTAPGAETLAELFGGEPSLILLDELSVYLRKARQLHGTAAGEQMSAFLTSLFKAVESNPRVSLVYTLAIGKEGKATDAYTAENQFIADKMAEAESISARKATLLNPTEDHETVQVLLRRLFAKIDAAKAAPVLDAYRSLWLSSKDVLPPDANHPETSEAFRASYPFHPEVLDTLTTKTATLQNFQRVRGMLRLLARTIGQLWQTHPAGATAIHLHHVDLGFEPIRQEIFTKLGRTEFIPAVNHDIVGGTKKPLAVELDEKHYTGLAPYTTYTARTVFIHSLAFNDQLKGLSMERLRFSTLGPAYDLSFIDAAWKRFRDESAYLDDRPGVPLRFLAEANLTQVIRREETNVDSAQARGELNDRIKTIFGGTAGSVFEMVPFPAAPGEVDDDLGNGRPRLAVMAYDGLSVGATVDAIPELITRIFERKGSDGVGLRSLRNHLVFVAADETRSEEMRKKMVRRLALAELIKPGRIDELADHQQRKVRELEGKSELELATAIQQCYRHVFYPSRQRLPGSPVDMAHAAVDIHTASEKPGSGQQQIVRTLRESANQKLRLSEDPPESPGYIRDRTPLKKGQISTATLRDEFRKDPALSIHASDSVLIRAITQGIQQGDYVYRRGELLCGPGDPMASIIIDEQSFVFTMQFAKEKSIWPRPAPTPSTPTTGSETSGTVYPPGAASGSLVGHEGGPPTPTPPPPPPPGAITAEGVLKAALTELWEKARKAKFAQVQVLSVRLFDGTDAFRMLGSVNAEKGCSKQVTLTGGYVTTEGGEMQLEFKGAPGDALPVKDFLVPQLNAARERDVQATFILTFNPGLLLAGDAAEKLTERLAKFASGAAYVSATAEATA